MRRIPIWIVAVLVVLTGLLLWIGIDERHEIGPVPIILGVLWGLFVLGTAGKIFSRD